MHLIARISHSQIQMHLERIGQKARKMLASLFGGGKKSERENNNENDEKQRENKKTEDKVTPVPVEVTVADMQKRY